ncbi:MAG: hypothetical protein UW30_C0010G0018 [Candidatus Giovannonibacteria bacterium GW2011_GWA2_44_13b]|uniref:Transglycosylase SLT domain-containing protein n=2 Tax=Candidatus Giovannoniibacteriota TaxID=1752738 RepID=A0A0G1JB70_9BACT|nr:MAG: hypothetical protein UW30_C0010G0018 [Candidatus Giovannonibacteria bacterium GW2011_GWA2_44_13b]OGF83080.1 MAG: hypothetical protein A2924_02145 [Candidatus Giovannonibacteria bacterium RIFCSPLOWO2_01_FULL_44_16]
MGKISKLALGLVLVLGFFAVRENAFAQVDPALVAEQRAKLEAELADYEKQIAQFQNLIVEKQKQGDSLKRDVDILKAQISKAKLAIKARNLTINKLIQEINEKSKNIGILGGEIDDAKASLAQFLRQIRENDDLSTVELALVYRDLSQFFTELESLSKVQESLHESYDKINNLKMSEEKAKTDYEDRKQEELELKALQELERKSLEKNEANMQKLLKDTKGKETEYQKLQKNVQKTAANIRSQLFLLEGSPSISFEKALEFANFAETVTGVRPAFLLGILTQETELGKNIGQCLLTNTPKKGDGVGKNTGTFFSGVMKPTRDVDPFMAITMELGLDPKIMPVSCPQSSGYGGAMGPAQFIPSTWVLYVKKITSLTGHNPPSPWDPQDAFAASALLLKDNGAGTQTYNAEWTAAMKYFAGGNWNKKAYRFYGDNVMAIATKYQDQIDLLASLAQR